MTQMTNHKKTEMIYDFDLVSTKNQQFSENFWKIEAICLKTALKIIFWRPPLGTKQRYCQKGEGGIQATKAFCGTDLGLW